MTRSSSPPTSVAVGDFVKSTLIGLVCGFVVAVKDGMLGREPATIVDVQCSDGRIEHVHLQYIDLIAPADERGQGAA
jgi:hypothetical protein